LAAAARSASFLFAGKIETEVPRAVVNKDLCIGCGTCEAVCPYGAVRVERRRTVQITKVACKGCGICVAECPMRAMQLQNYRDEQLFAQLGGLLSRSAV
jgi:heterodisulfide reductase subunit A